MARNMNLFTAYFLFLLTAFIPLSIRSQTSKGITNNYDSYSPWSPGDAGVYVDKDGNQSNNPQGNWHRKAKGTAAAKNKNTKCSFSGISH